MARYNHGCLTDTVSVAFKIAVKNNKPVFVIAVYGGYRIVHEKPAGFKSFYIVNASGQVDLDEYDCMTGTREVKQVNYIRFAQEAVR